MHSFFPYPHILPKAANPHSWISSCCHSCELLPTAKALLWVHQGLQWHTCMASLLKYSSLSSESHCSVDVHENFIRCKPVNQPGKWGGKRNRTKLQHWYSYCLFSPQWVISTPDVLLLNTSLPRMLLLLKKTVHNGGVLFYLQCVTKQITQKSREDSGPKEPNVIHTKSSGLKIRIKPFLNVIKLKSPPTTPLIQV